MLFTLVSDTYPLTHDALYQKMRDDGILARRYFYPLISDPMYRGLLSASRANLPAAANIALRVLGPINDHSNPKFAPR